MNKNLIVGFAGRIGAGKSSVSAAFAANLGWKFASFGAFVRKTASERSMDFSRESLQAIFAEIVLPHLAQDLLSFFVVILSLWMNQRTNSCWSIGFVVRRDDNAPTPAR